MDARLHARRVSRIRPAGLGPGSRLDARPDRFLSAALWLRPSLLRPRMLHAGLFYPAQLHQRLLYSGLFRPSLFHSRLFYAAPEGLAGRGNRRPRSGHVLLRSRMPVLDALPMRGVMLPRQPIALSRPDPPALDLTPSSFDVHDFREAPVPGDIDEGDVAVPVESSPEPEPDEGAAAKEIEASPQRPSDRAVVIRLVSGVGPWPVHDERVVDRHVDHQRAGRLSRHRTRWAERGSRDPLPISPTARATAGEPGLLRAVGERQPLLIRQEILRLPRRRVVRRPRTQRPLG